METRHWSYVSGTSEKPLIGETIGDMFDQTVARFPENEALVCRQQGLRYTYAQLKDEVDRCARGLMALGLAKGERIGIWAPNRAEWAITQLATAKIGAILVNLNPSYRLHEIEFALNQSGCTMVDEEGYINIVGRIKDMIIRGGENIYPREIEEFLYSHPKIADVQVIGVPDLKYGEEIMAWVRLKPGESASEEEIRAFCKGQIAHYKSSRYVKFVNDFPMTVTGKIQKFLMRKQSIDELHLTDAAAVQTA